MASIDVDTVIRGLGSDNKAVGRFAEQQQSIWQKLVDSGAQGAAVTDFGAAIKELKQLDKFARTEASASGTKLSPGETLDLSTSLRSVGDLGASALRDQVANASVCRVPPESAANATPTGNPRGTDPAATGTYREGASLEGVAKSGKVLSQGDKGDGVSAAQSLLNQIKGADGQPKYALGGYGDKKDGVDGRLGPKTTAAIEQFKKDQGLKSDGKGTVDKETLDRLQAVAGASSLDGAYAPIKSSPGGRTDTRSAEANAATPERESKPVSEQVSEGAAVGAIKAGKVIASVKEVPGPKNQVVPYGSKIKGGGTFEVPTNGQVAAGRLLKGAGVVGVAIGAVGDAKALGEAAGADTVRGDGKHTELINQGAKVAGHWTGAAVGAKAAVAVTTPFALATGPAAPFIIGAAGLVGGGLGYFLGDAAGEAAGHAITE